MLCRPWEGHTDLEDTEQQEHADEHGREACDEPREPVTGVAHTHHLHHFLQALLLLVDDSLDDHRRREDPRDRHEQWEASGDPPHEAATTDDEWGTGQDLPPVGSTLHNGSAELVQYMDVTIVSMATKRPVSYLLLYRAFSFVTVTM